MTATATKDATKWTEQVSFIIQHDVKPGMHEAYERWLKKTIAEAAKFPGHMGTHVAKPGPDQDMYEISVRFASRQYAENWINSDMRHQLVEELKPIISSDEKLNIKSGIDYWFTSYTAGHKAPKRWKQWMMTVSVIWVLTLIIPHLLAPLFNAVPILNQWGPKQGITAMVVVFFVVYVVMPPYAKLLSKWLSR